MRQSLKRFKKTQEIECGCGPAWSRHELPNRKKETARYPGSNPGSRTTTCSLQMVEDLNHLRRLYLKEREAIRKRLSEFSQIYENGTDEDLFRELAFCILTPQSRARVCDAAIRSMGDLIFRGTEKEIRAGLRGVRFANNKAHYMVDARTFFAKHGGMRKTIDSVQREKLRDWLAENIMGIGMKEAGHFIRNIGLGQNIAILDVHILHNLLRYNVIDKIPESMSKRCYLDIEERMRHFSGKVGIPMDELDLLFWSHETGEIFK